jgi:hypothetical protein
VRAAVVDEQDTQRRGGTGFGHGRNERTS